MADRILTRLRCGEEHFSRPYTTEALALMGDGNILVLKDTPFTDGMYLIGRRIIFMEPTAERIDRIEIYLEWYRAL